MINAFVALTNYLTAIADQHEDEPSGSQIPQPTADPSGFPLEDAVSTILNVLTWAGYAAAVGGVIIGGAIIAFSHATSNTMWGSRGKSMALVALAGGLIVGVAGQLVQWAADLG